MALTVSGLSSNMSQDKANYSINFKRDQKYTSMTDLDQDGLEKRKQKAHFHLFVPTGIFR